MWQKLKKCLNKHLVMMLWVTHEPTTGFFNSLKMAKHQLMMTIVLDLQLAQCRKMLQKCEGNRQDQRRTIHDVCNIMGLSYWIRQRILSNST
jgi:hypothetical protein